MTFAKCIRESSRSFSVGVRLSTNPDDAARRKIEGITLCDRESKAENEAVVFKTDRQWLLTRSCRSMFGPEEPKQTANELITPL